MISENITITNLDDYLNDFFQCHKIKDSNVLSDLDIECMYIEHRAKAYSLAFNAIQPGDLL